MALLPALLGLLAAPFPGTAALLVVRPGPSITNAPASIGVRVPPDLQANPTNRATFTVGGVSYNPPLRYQWFFNGNPILDATNAAYSFTNVTLAHEGLYSAQLTDSIGLANTLPAQLTGLVTPSLTFAPLPQTSPQGALITVSAACTGNPLPVAWEWRRISTPIQITTNNDRFSYLSFFNTNPIGTPVLDRVIARNQAGTTSPRE